jgi:hypothetical protein
LAGQREKGVALALPDETFARPDIGFRPCLPEEQTELIHPLPDFPRRDQVVDFVENG